MRFAIGAVARISGNVRNCGYKQKHWTRDAAARHLDALRWTLKQRGRMLAPMNIYRCRNCGAWHLGRNNNWKMKEWRDDNHNG